MIAIAFLYLAAAWVFSMFLLAKGQTKCLDVFASFIWGVFGFSMVLFEVFLF
jgi:hypothetical protein